MLIGKDGDLAVGRGELARIVGEGVNHEEGEHTVCFNHGGTFSHIQCHTFYIKRRLALAHYVKDIGYGETLDMQAELALAHLNPFGEQGVVFVNLVGELKDIVVSLLAKLRRLVGARHKHSHLVDDTVDERSDTVDERHLRTVFKILTCIVGSAHLAHQPFLVDFLDTLLGELALALLLLLPLAQWLQQRVEFVLAAVATREVVEQP